MDNLFILESHKGEHHSIDKRFSSDKASFTFVPIVNSFAENEDMEDFSSFMPDKIKPIRINSIVTELDSFYEFAKKYKRIYIGFDLDVMGNAMARIVHDYLISNGYKDRIIRIPLVDSGFKYISSFWDNKNMNWYINYMREEMEYINYSKKTLGSYGVGRRTPLILNELENNRPNYVANINPDATSSITYIFKKKIKE